MPTEAIGIVEHVLNSQSAMSLKVVEAAPTRVEYVKLNVEIGHVIQYCDMRAVIKADLCSFRCLLQ